MTTIARRSFIKGAAAAGAALGLLPSRAAHAQADNYPNRPVRFVVPLAPGGGLDLVARLAGEYLSRASGLGQQVVIENRTGGGGTIGFDTVMKSTPDGYTVLVTNDNIASAPHVLRLAVDYNKEFIPVIQLARQSLAFAAHPSIGINSMSELIAKAKSGPAIGVATSGVGSNQHVLLEWVGQVAGVKFDHVPYRGAGQAINDLVAGHIKVGCLGPTALVPHYNVGNLRMIAQSGERRSPSLPNVPTLVEQGLKDVVIDTWYGAFVPLNTPPPVVARLNAEMDKAMKDPASRDSLLKTATEPVGGTAEHMARVLRRDSDTYGRLIRELNIRTN